jgi:hypothetical protein
MSVPQGIKVHGEWVQIVKNRVFRLIEGDDPKLMLGASFAWSDLGNLEIFPVMESEEVMKLMPKA